MEDGVLRAKSPDHRNNETLRVLDPCEDGPPMPWAERDALCMAALEVSASKLELSSTPRLASASRTRGMSVFYF